MKQLFLITDCFLLIRIEQNSHCLWVAYTRTCWPSNVYIVLVGLFKLIFILTGKNVEENKKSNFKPPVSILMSRFFYGHVSSKR
jgi:hypothetical protein